MQQLINNSITKLQNYHKINNNNPSFIKSGALKKIESHIEYLQQNTNSQFNFTEKQIEIFNKTIEQVHEKKLDCTKILDIQFTLLKAQREQQQETQEIKQENVKYCKTLKGSQMVEEMILNLQEVQEDQKLRQAYQTFYENNQNRLQNYKTLQLKVKGIANLVKIQLKGQYESYQDFVADVHTKADQYYQANKSIRKIQKQTRQAQQLNIDLENQLKETTKGLYEMLSLNTLAQYHDILIPCNSSYLNIQINTERIIEQAQNLLLLREMQQKKKIQQQRTIKHQFNIQDNKWFRYTFTCKFDEILDSSTYKKMIKKHRVAIKTCIQNAQDYNQDLYFKEDYEYDEQDFKIRRSTKGDSKFIINFIEQESEEEDD